MVLGRALFPAAHLVSLFSTLFSISNPRANQYYLCGNSAGFFLFFRKEQLAKP